MNRSHRILEESFGESHAEFVELQTSIIRYLVGGEFYQSTN